MYIANYRLEQKSRRRSYPIVIVVLMKKYIRILLTQPQKRSACAYNMQFVGKFALLLHQTIGYLSFLQNNADLAGDRDIVAKFLKYSNSKKEMDLYTDPSPDQETIKTNRSMLNLSSY